MAKVSRNAIGSLRTEPKATLGAVLGFALLLSSVLLHVPAAAQAATPIRLSLDRRIDGTAAPFVVAQSRGLFRAEGVDVSLDAANGSSEALDRVASGDRDMAAVDLNALIRFRSKPAAPAVQAVYILHNRVGYSITARKSRGVVSLATLQGKTMGVAEGDLAIAAWPGLARRNGVDPSKVHLEKIGAAVREPMLSAGQVDAVSGFAFGSGLNVKDRGVPASDLVVLKYAELGSELYGLALIVNPAFAAAKPEAVKGMLRAITIAIKSASNDPARAIDDTMASIDGGARDLELERLRLVLRDNIVTDEVRHHGLGGIDAARFRIAIDQLAEDFKFRDRPALSDIFNDSFLPPAAARKLD